MHRVSLIQSALFTDKRENITF